MGSANELRGIKGLAHLFEHVLFKGAHTELAPTRPAGLADVAFADACRVWARVGLQSFGGPAGQIAVMHRILVEEKGWLDERRFLHALNYCMLLPGPEAQQLATYCGWLLHGYRGGLVAGSLFVLPGFVAILALSYLYVAFAGAGLVAALFFGLKAAVLAVVVQAVIRIGRRVLSNAGLVTIAGAAFVAIFFFSVPFPLIVLGAATIGFAGARLAPRTFLDRGGKDAEAVLDAADPARSAELAPRPTSARRALRVTAIALALWWVPIALLAFALGADDVLVREAVFFSKAAVVTFGGAYAVLSYIAQQAVERYGWLQPGEMLDGLGMAETTPGPLIMVVQFVGFMGAYRHPGSLDPLLAGTLGAILTTWVTFVPCFLWIFLGAPYVERLRGHAPLGAALAAVTAAVVGVILNLALWFAVNTLFTEVAEVAGPLGLELLVPRWSTVDLAAVAISLAAMVALLRFRVGLAWVLAGCALAGLAVEGLRG